LGRITGSFGGSLPVIFTVKVSVKKMACGLCFTELKNYLPTFLFAFSLFCGLSVHAFINARFALFLLLA